MKVLSIEQKAKAYDEALKIAKEAAEKGMVSHNFVSDIFPELKESEDERIRKHLIGVVELYYGNTDEHEKKDCLDWLERQGEQNQKHFELKAGHWYICHRAYCCRADHLTVKEGERFMCEKDGIVKGFVIKDPEKYFKEVCAPAPMEDEEKPANWLQELEDKLANATPKQLDEWKEKYFKEEPDEWSEEDMCYYDAIIAKLEVTQDDALLTDNQMEFLKSIKDRVQPKQEWSEEDERILTDLITSLIRISAMTRTDSTSVNFDFAREIDWLKSLSPQSQWKPSDEQMEALESATENCAYSEYQDCLRELIAQLKKLREE